MPCLGPIQQRIVSINHLVCRRRSLLTGVGTPGGGRSYSPTASEWRHGARIQPDDRFAGALLTRAPPTRRAATVAAPWRRSPASSYRWVNLLSRRAPQAWRPARRPPRGFGIRRFRIQTGKDLLNEPRGP
jgi:hypothetical protein